MNNVMMKKKHYSVICLTCIDSINWLWNVKVAQFLVAVVISSHFDGIQLILGIVGCPSALWRIIIHVCVSTSSTLSLILQGSNRTELILALIHSHQYEGFAYTPFLC